MALSMRTLLKRLDDRLILTEDSKPNRTREFVVTIDRDKEADINGPQDDFESIEVSVEAYLGTATSLDDPGDPIDITIKSAVIAGTQQFIELTPAECIEVEHLGMMQVEEMLSNDDQRRFDDVHADERYRDMHGYE